MKKSKKQHYVPRFYLKGFLHNDCEQLLVFDKVQNKTFLKNIEEVCEQNYYYSYRDNKKNYNDYNYLVEDYLSRKEYEFSLVFEKIIKNIEDHYYKSKEMKRLFHEDRQNLLEFLYYQILRVPKYIDKLFFNGIKYLKELNKKYNRVQNEKEIVNDLKSIMFPRLFNNVQEFISIMNKRNLAFFIIDKNITECFVSTDNPVLITNSEINVDRVGIIDPRTEVSIPISKNILLVIGKTHIKYKLEYHIINSVDRVKNLNVLIRNNAMRFIYSGQENLLN